MKKQLKTSSGKSKLDKAAFDFVMGKRFSDAREAAKKAANEAIEAAAAYREKYSK